ncbi:MAG: chemotaxis protein CheB [Methylococcus sp.]
MKKKKNPCVVPANCSSDETTPVPSVSIPTEEACAFCLARDDFPIVGIGASAGGLAAFEAFFSGMPADTEPGMAFVLVQHLAPDHKSILADIIRHYTRMQVFEVEDGMQIQSNCAYIIPPNRDMALLNGALQLLEPIAPRGQRLPIDFFFRSLARNLHARAIGVVLSGTGSDGTLGVRAIKGEGGMVMAQNPESTEYDGMPRSAIGTGLVDYVLPAAEMPAQLIAYMTHAFGKPSPGKVPTPQPDNAMKNIFALLRAKTGHDFSQYKPSTIGRRIKRRMAMRQFDSMDSYAKYVQRTPDEVAALFRDMLIGVTSFFRDPKAFTTLEKLIIPKLFAGKGADATIRIWVPGCSTGEEAYSLAILLAEHQEVLKQNFKAQIFATDIDSHAIATARAAIYPASIAADLTPERLARFFEVESGNEAYRVRKSLRDLLVFSEQNVIKDPPFSKLDLISCRNLLIYLDGDLQKRLIPLFHYALNPGGYLFLGISETVAEFGDLFATLERNHKIFQRNEAPLRQQGLGQFQPPMTHIDAAASRAAGNPTVGKMPPLRELTEQALLEQLVQAGALVNAAGDILYLHGRAGLYLEPAPGVSGPSNILKMAREGLRRDLGTALRRAGETGETVCYPAMRVKTNGDFSTVNLTVRRVAVTPAAAPAPPLYLVILEQARKPVIQEPAGKPSSEDPGGEDADVRIAALKRELQTKDQYLQNAIEGLEASNAELKCINEEMQSVNEELQSTNEELETSKEELQSVNEELATVNAELQTKVADLSRANNDMNNLLAGTGIATVFVDHQLRLLRFTPAATKIINLIHADIGRPVGHIVSNLNGYNTLTADIQAVLDTLSPRETEVQTADGSWYIMRILPYRTMNNVIEGAVLTFVNNTEARKQREDLQLKEREFRSLANSMPQIVWATRPDGWNIYFNEQWVDYTGLTLEESYGHGWIIPFHPEDKPRAWDAWQQATQNNGVYSLECRLRRADGAYRWWLIRGVPLHDASGTILKWFGTCTDIEDIKQAEEANRRMTERLRLANKATNDVIWDWDIVHDTQQWNEAGTTIFGWTESVEHPVNAQWWVERVHPDDRDRVRDTFLAVVNNPELETWHDEYRFRKADGAYAVVLDHGHVSRDEQGKGIRMIGAMQDITERKQMEEALKKSSQAKSEFLANMSHEIRTPMNAILGLTQILERGPLTPDQRDLIQKIRDAGRGLLHIINDILDFSKIEAGQLKVERHPFDLLAVLESLTSLLAASAFDKHLEFSAPRPPIAAGQLIGDPLRVKQVLINLASNAIKFTEQGRVEIRVIQMLETETSIRLRFEVEDTGIGIAPETLAHLFQAFTQADASTTRRFGGTGLGLAISKRLVDQMGGEIGANSTPGEGSTFWFELPFGRGSEEDAPSANRAAAVSPTQGPRLSGLRVLAVDDNHVNLFMLERALQLEGARVELAADGQQCLQTLAAQPRGFDVVLMDIQMPVMDGLTATRAIRANPALAALPVIALTAGVLAEEREATLAAGLNDFLAKPLDIEDMVAKLQAHAPGRDAYTPMDPPNMPVRRVQSAPTGDPDDRDAFPIIAGIDNVRVARLLGHDRAHFLRLLGLFIEEFQSLPQQLQAELDTHDREAAIRRAHTLKGSAGNLGMIDLMRAAATLETALREATADLAAPLAHLRGELEALIEAATPWLNEAPAAADTPAPPLDPAQLAALRQALRQHDLAAIKLHAELEPALAGVCDAPTGKDLARAIGHLRFEEALQLLERCGP